MVGTGTDMEVVVVVVAPSSEGETLVEVMDRATMDTGDLTIINVSVFMNSLIQEILIGIFV